MRQSGTVLVMCPLMSLIASIIFQIILGKQSIGQFPVIWIGTIMKNFPMGFLDFFKFESPMSHVCLELQTQCLR